MSRIGKKPIVIPAGVEIKVSADNKVEVKGPMGTLTQSFHPNMTIKTENGSIIVERPSDDKFDRSLHGLTRALINNMVLQKALRRRLKSTVLVTEHPSRARSLF